MNSCTLKFVMLTLVACSVPGIQALEPTMIEKEAQLISLVGNRDVEQFKKQFSRVPRGHIIQTQVIDFIKAVRNQKIAQIASNIGRSQKAAAVKTVLWSFVGVAFLYHPVTVYLAFSWASENAQFAHHGNKLLVQDICTFDEMLLYATSVA